VRQTMLAVAIALAGSPPPAIAQGRPEVLGWGNAPCSSYVIVRERDDTPSFEFSFAILGWVEGYATAAAVSSPGMVLNFGSLDNGNKVTLWLDGYCSSHPSAPSREQPRF
jgi:hypothetical protein